MSDESERKCPECGADVQNTIAYVRGNRTSDGWECTDCEWSCFFGEEPDSWPDPE